ncbi:hypothetical protein GPECTOR_32g425 [Gonium pectorale]|uniref:SWIRM domain-containing protein n=1 Tax=Gonium pectorale TaxID=33097 RepID=A0A150GDF9_GONPE|nr:hypothetical protein GPECTOR_32g425 [Gonium pectorale]|eukprot:KXZ47813.1 hypothetical protein GPECTOR_32g425 [Gonium pectorale]
MPVDLVPDDGPTDEQPSQGPDQLPDEQPPQAPEAVEEEQQQPQPGLPAVSQRPQRRRIEPQRLGDVVPHPRPQRRQQGQQEGSPEGEGGSERAHSGPTAGGEGTAAGGGDGRPPKRSRVSEERLQEDVASSVGLDPWGLGEEEEALLADVEAQRPGQPRIGRQAYLRVRNFLLTVWRINVRRHLSMEDASRAVLSQHAEVAWSFLHTYGYINFGTAATAQPGMQHAETVIVIGAGLSGLAAATQLRQLGYRVLVLEARDRPGGRVHTERMEAGGVVGWAECGGSILTGCDGNPLAVLALQGGLPLHSIAEATPLYWADGSPVDEELDRQASAGVVGCEVMGLVTDRYNEVLERCDALCQQLEPTAGELISIEAALSALWQEATAKERQQRSAAPAGEGGGGPDGAGAGDAGADEGRASLSDQLFHWHVANLEFANAAPAGELSLRHWAQDDAYELLGDHAFTTGGNGRLVQLLTRNLPIMYRCPVAEVRYSSGSGEGRDGGGVTVVAESGQVFEASAAVVTLPLGVLKADVVRFEPPLPAPKLDAIKRLGYGRLNKVSLLFPRVFWDTSVDTFAAVMKEKERRGAYYLFYCGAHTGGAAVLTALVAGSAAIAIESMTDEQAVAEVMTVLRNIFERPGGKPAATAAGRPVVPTPLQAVVTRWGSDPYSRGSYSSMALSCRGAAEYAAMAAPVAGRLFFAGEATIHKYPATMHGAFLSGLREAGRIHYAFARARHGLPPRSDPAEAGGPNDVSGPLLPAPPSGPALLAVRRLAALACGLRALFSRAEPDLEFGCFKALWGPQAPGQQQWALVQIDLGYVRSRSTTAGADAAPDGANEGGAAGGGSVVVGGRARRGGGASTSASAAARPGGHRRRALVHLPLPRAAVEALWCMRGGDDARLVALTQRFGFKLPGMGCGSDWDPTQQLEQLYSALSEKHPPGPLPPGLAAAAGATVAAVPATGAS